MKCQAVGAWESGAVAGLRLRREISLHAAIALVFRDRGATSNLMKRGGDERHSGGPDFTLEQVRRRSGSRSAGSRSAGRQRDRSAFFHPNHAPAAMLVRNACRVARKSSSTRWLATASAAMPPPLKGIKIVDLTRVLAGPYATASTPTSRRYRRSTLLTTIYVHCR